jgi:hypothetical protein
MIANAAACILAACQQPAHVPAASRAVVLETDGVTFRGPNSEPNFHATFAYDFRATRDFQAFQTWASGQHFSLQEVGFGGNLWGPEPSCVSCKKYLLSAGADSARKAERQFVLVVDSSNEIVLIENHFSYAPTTP